MSRPRVLPALLSILLLALPPSSKAQENWCASLGIDLARGSVSTLQAGIEQIEAGEIPDAPPGTPAEIEAMYREALNASLDCVEFLSGRGDVPISEPRPDSLQFVIPMDLGRRPAGDAEAMPASPVAEPASGLAGVDDPTALPPIPEIDAADAREVGAPGPGAAPEPTGAAAPPAAAVPCEFTTAELLELQGNLGLLRFITSQQRADLIRRLEAQQGCGDPAQAPIVNQLLAALRG